ncbi:hypothetical protein CALCODRAFT_478974 [Calocera cornea HHB12733]|uniref:DUF7514 domain-containing protein n=1 Tax=Calocera cornea HHB12733 TaxID=1353952 RepID=A0A165K4T3_9BASI|nr:hypothetical protein CALCODRAFT_478974 [Calocera cornea HHB12733]
MGFLSRSRSRKSVRSNTKTRETLASLAASAPSSSSSPLLPASYASRARSLPPLQLPAVPVYPVMPAVPLVQMPYAPGQPPPQFVTYVPYAGARSPPVLSPPILSPLSPIGAMQRPPMSRQSSTKLHSPRKERERMSRALAYAGSPPPSAPISPIPVQHMNIPGVQINTRGSLASPAAMVNPSSPVYYPPITRFCPHCNSRVPTEHHFQFCSACQRPLSAYPQRPPSVMPEADGFAIPGISGQPALSPRDMARNGSRETGRTTGYGTAVPTHKMNISEAPTVSSAIGSPVYSSPASSPIGSLDGGGLGTKVGSDAGPGATHPAGREALVLPNGKATPKLEALSIALADWLFKQVPTKSGLVDMSRTYFLEWAWGRSDFLTLFNADTTQRLYNALEYEYANVVTQHPQNAAVVERTPALSRKGLQQFLTHEILVDPAGASARLKRLLATYGNSIGPPPPELGIGSRWRVDQYMMLRAPHPIATQRQKRLVQTMRGLGWELGTTLA